MQKDRDELDAATKAAYAELVKAKVVPDGGDPRKQLAEGTKKIRENAESPLVAPLTQLGSSLSTAGLGMGKIVEKGMDMSAVASETNTASASSSSRPRSKARRVMSALCCSDRKLEETAKDLDSILHDTKWVLSKEAKQGPQAIAKALLVRGLALRNQENFDDARKALNQAATTPGAKGASVAQAKLALKELTDANAYYLPQIGKLQAAGNLKAAINAANVAIKALPDNGKLIAERGLLTPSGGLSRVQDRPRTREADPRPMRRRPPSSTLPRKALTFSACWKKSCTISPKRRDISARPSSPTRATMMRQAVIAWLWPACCCTTGLPREFRRPKRAKTSRASCRLPRHPSIGRGWRLSIR